MRIASLSPATTEILFGLGVGKAHEIVCVDQFSNLPDVAKTLPHLRDHMKVDPEALKRYQPDIIFTATVIQEELSKQLKAAGLSVIHQDPRTLHQIYESIFQIGGLFSLEDAARALVLTMQQGFNDVKRKAIHLIPRPHVYVEEWHDPPYASGNWVPEVARIAGGEQFPIPSGSLSPEVSLEQIQKWNPELIILSICGAGSLVETSLITKRSGWDSLTAILEGKVKVIDDSLLNRPGP